MALSLNPIDQTYNIYEDDLYQRLGTDTVLLSEFAVKKRNSLVCDLGSGQGGLSLLMLISQPTITVHGVEIDPHAAEISRLNMSENGFADKFTLHVGDMASVDISEKGKFDEVVSNPPYFKPISGKIAKTAERQIARCDFCCSPQVLCDTACKLLRFGGTFSVVYRCERLVDMINAMRNAKIEPKTMQFIQNDKDTAPKIVLISGRKCGSPSLKILPPLFLKERYNNTKTANNGSQNGV